MGLPDTGFLQTFWLHIGEESSSPQQKKEEGPHYSLTQVNLMLTCLPLSKEEEENLADILDLPKLERNQPSENRQETKGGLQLRKHSKRATEHQEEI